MKKTNVPGNAPKPDFCLHNCPRGIYGGVGFVPDFVGSRPKVGILLHKPTNEEIIHRDAFSSGLSRFWFATAGRACGLSKENLIVSYVLRCGGAPPVGWARPKAEAACRAWDDKSRDKLGLPGVPGGVIGWNPNLFIVTFSLTDCVEVDAFQACMVEDFKKAMRFAASGYRPLVIMGLQCMELFPFMRNLGGGVKRWRGHWWEGSWPFTPPVVKNTYEKNALKLYEPRQKETAPAPEQKGFDFGN